ncbi:MAG: hypothetical protein ACYDDV_02565 [Methanoregula sp.]
MTAAPIVSIPIFIFLNFICTVDLFFLITGICILFAGIVPIFLILIWTRRIKKTTMDIPNKEDRPILLGLIILSYLTGTIVLYLLNADWLVSGLMFCYLTNTIVILIINFFWKISVHSMGIAAPMAALFFINVFSGLLLGGLLLCVMWSRVHLKRHTVTQVLAGGFFGFLFTLLQLIILKPSP